METWYRVSRYGKPEIKPFVVLGRTACFLTIENTYYNWRTGKEDKSGTKRERIDGDVFSTFDAAKQALIDRSKKHIEQLGNGLLEERHRLAQILELTLEAK